MDFAHLLHENPGAEELREAGFPIPEGSRALVKGWTVEIPAGGAVDPEIQVEIVCLEEPPTLSPAIYQATSPGAEPVERKGRTGRRLIVNADGTLPEIPEGEDYAELDRVRDRGVPAFSAKVLGSSFAGASAAAAATSGALKSLGAELRKAAEKMAEAQTALEGRTLGWGDVNAMNRSLAEDVRDLCHRIMADGDLSAEEVDGLIGALHAKPTAEQPAPLLDYFQEHIETLHHAAERSKVHALPYLTLEGLDSAPGDAWTVRRSRGALGAVAPAPEGGRRTELGSRSVEFTIESKLDPLESRRLREFLGALDDPTGAGFLIQTPAQAARAAELESYFPSIRKDWGKGPSLGVGDAVRVRVDGVNRPGTVAGFEGRNVLVNVGAHAGRALAFRPEDVVPDRHLLPAKSATDALLAWCDRKGVPLSAAPLIANHIHRRALYQGEGAPPRPEHMIPGERWTEMTTRGPRFYVDRGGPRRDHAGRAGRAHGGDRWRTSQPASR